MVCRNRLDVGIVGIDFGKRILERFFDEDRVLSLGRSALLSGRIRRFLLFVRLARLRFLRLFRIGHVRFSTDVRAYRNGVAI